MSLWWSIKNNNEPICDYLNIKVLLYLFKSSKKLSINYLFLLIYVKRTGSSKPFNNILVLVNIKRTRSISISKLSLSLKSNDSFFSNLV